jgi:hypothetical protein
MKFVVFERIYSSTSNDLCSLANQFSTTEDVIKSIFSKRAHYQMMASLGKLNSSYPSDHLYRLHHEDGKSIKDLGTTFNLPELVIARILLKFYFPQVSPTQIFRDSNLIEGIPNLKLEVDEALKTDFEHSPSMDQIKNDLGRAYEEKIRLWLQSNSIPFYEEKEERAKGVPKTPDFRLILPIAISLDANNDSMHVITWLESKAMFGDPKADAGYHKEQYRPYWNRFGPGLVIYWFDFVEDDPQSINANGEEDECKIYRMKELPIKFELIKLA